MTIHLTQLQFEWLLIQLEHTESLRGKEIYAELQTHLTVSSCTPVAPCPQLGTGASFTVESTERITHVDGFSEDWPTDY